MIKQDVFILLDVLESKKKYFSQLLHLTEEQNRILTEKKLDINEFDKIFKEKDNIIDKVNKYDEGFSIIYDKIREQLQSSKDQYKSEIGQMQELIKQLTEYGLKIKNIEQKNKQLFDNYILSQRKQVGVFKKNQNIISAYNKSMRKNSYNESFFLDKKK